MIRQTLFCAGGEERGGGVSQVFCNSACDSPWVSTCLWLLSGKKTLYVRRQLYLFVVIISPACLYAPNSKRERLLNDTRVA